MSRLAQKRVLHIVSAMNRGGAETLLMNVYRNIDRNKVQFDFVSHRQEICDYDEEIESLGGKIYHLESLGRSGPFKYVTAIRKILEQEKYIAVHSHTDFQCGFPALAAKLEGVKKIACHAHTNKMLRNGGITNKAILPILRALIKYSSTDYCACSSEAAQFLFGKNAMDKVKILKNGINIEDFIFCDGDFGLREELSLSNDTKILGHVGNLSRVKNHQFILKTLKNLIDEGISAVAVFAGDGPLRQELEEQAKQLGIPDFVYFLGVRNDIPNLMKAFDVFVFPSLYEGFGIVAIEVQCAGTPCVASDTIPRSTDLGLGLMSYISLNDGPKKWANEIKKALMKKEPNQQTIRNRFQETGFNINTSVSDWLKLYGITG